MTDNSILNMVGGEKHINPHYDIKEESANKGFTGIEVNGVRFSNIQEMLVYMDKQRNEIILLEKENAELKAYNEKLLDGDIEKHNKIVELKEQVDTLANVNIKAQNIIGKAKELIEDLIKFQPYIDREAFFISLGNEWKTAIYKAEQFLKEVKE